MDLGYIHSYLSNTSYWAKGRSVENVKLSMDSSLCFGVFDQGDKQVGFARLVTDWVVFGWIMDVFIDEHHRGEGLGKSLMDHILSYPGVKNINGIGLRTNDAHELYKKFGFAEIEDAETWMLKRNS
ncbi:MAG: GNAT family N-acetyltransferase [Bacteroidota bacterium]